LYQGNRFACPTLVGTYTVMSIYDHHWKIISHNVVTNGIICTPNSLWDFLQQKFMLMLDLFCLHWRQAGDPTIGLQIQGLVPLHQLSMHRNTIEAKAKSTLILSPIPILFR
jgi:hypothetical protein